MGAQQSSGLHTPFEWYFTPKTVESGRKRHRDTEFLTDLSEYGMLAHTASFRDISKMCYLCSRSDIMYMHHLLTADGNNTYSIIMSNRTFYFIMSSETFSPVKPHPEDQEKPSFLPSMRDAIMEHKPDVIAFPVAFVMTNGGIRDQCCVLCDARSGNIYVYSPNGKESIFGILITTYVIYELMPMLNSAYPTTKFYVMQTDYIGLQNKFRLHKTITGEEREVIKTNDTVYVWIVMFLSLLNDTNPYAVASDLANTFEQTAEDVKRVAASMLAELDQYMTTNPTFLRADGEEKQILFDLTRMNIMEKYKGRQYASLDPFRENQTALDIAQLGMDHLANVVSVNVARNTAQFLYNIMPREEADKLLRGNRCIQRSLHKKETNEFLKYWFGSLTTTGKPEEVVVINEGWKF
jgi:hypothetical protein